MEANARNLEQVFTQRCRYLVPLFQRPYVWQRESEWEPLWEDLKAVVERNLEPHPSPPHFLGAVVLEQIRTSTGAMESRQVIDGQQRLTTLQILMAALRDLCREGGGEKHVAALNQFVLNDDPYLDHEDHRFKVWPTNVDRDAFRAVMTSGSPAVLCEHFGAPRESELVGHRIGDAYLYFYRTVNRWLEVQTRDRDEVVRTLVLSLRGSLRLVVIDLDERDDPQVIFETLNARGTPLLAADLVKNLLFRVADRNGEPVRKLYETYWRSFDEDSAFWREEVRQGRLRHPRINVFLQHWLTLRLKRDVPVAQTFLAFRSMVMAGGETAEAVMRDLARYGSIFRSMFEWPSNSAEGLFFHRLALIDTSTVMPFLLELFAQLSSPDAAAERTAVLRDLESFLVRRTVCGLTMKNYNRLFLELSTWTQANGMTPASVRGFLLSLEGPSVRWPADNEFAAAWLEAPLYKSLVRRRLRMILEALDLELRSDLTEEVHIPEKLTIEHVLPQKWRENWPLPEIEDVEARLAADRRRDSYLHRIGNLTLLTSKLNPTLSNSAWEKKKAEITRHSALALNRHFHGEPAWSESTIERRSSRLLEVALEIWPHPRNGGTDPSGPSAPVDEEDSLVGRVRENLREVVAELAGKEPVDFVDNFTILYPQDTDALDALFAQTPNFGAREFIMQELAGIIRADPTLRFDAQHGGYVRRTQ